MVKNERKEYARDYAPIIHILHDKLLSLLQKFLACYIKTEFIPRTSRSLTNLNVKDRQLFLSHSQWFLGNKTKTLLEQCPASLRNLLIEKVESAFSETAHYLQKTLPFDNTALKCISTIDPRAFGHSVSQEHMLQISTIIPTVISESERDAFDLEVRSINLDQTLPVFNPSTQRIDNWWFTLTETGKYPLLCKASMALLTCFQHNGRCA
jgi:hypothetical protein